MKRRSSRLRASSIAFRRLCRLRWQRSRFRFPLGVPGRRAQWLFVAWITALSWLLIGDSIVCTGAMHATTSKADETWVKQLMGHIFPGQSIENLTIDDFKDTAMKIHAQEPDIAHWTFGKWAA